MPDTYQSFFGSALRQNLLELRRELHRNPELAFREHRTAERLFAELQKLRPYELTKVVETGIVAKIKGTNPAAPTVAIRGDIDALPITEETGLSYSSGQTGVMHACGHDVHATWTVGAAGLLAANPAPGDVLIVLQPAEEIAQGATAILATGILDGVSAIFGAHVDRRFEVGQVVAQEGPLAASSDTFEVDFVGKGAHAARPHEARDPIVAASAFVMTVQTLISRRLDPATAGVVTVAAMHAGDAANVIPERACLKGTIRATEQTTREFLQQQVRALAQSQAEMMGLSCGVRVHSGTPPIINPVSQVRFARNAVTTVLGKDALVPLGFTNMGGEDFACYMQKIPGCFLRIGAREPGGPVIAAHSPQFYAAEESIFVGAAVLAETARVATSGH